MNSPATQEFVKLEIVKQDMQFALHKVFKELDVKTSQSHVDCPVLINVAWIGMELMKNLPHSSYLLKPESLTTAFTELSAAMDDPFDAFHPPDTLPIDTYDPTKPCYLFTISRELRDMIYDPAISSGNIKILQTSKRLHKEGIELLYKRRVCHLNIDLTKYIPKISLQKPIAALIQNVNIEIVLKRYIGTRNCTHNIKAIRRFSGSTIRRQTCRVVLLFTFCDCSDKYAQYFRLYMRYLETLIGFSRLLLEVRF
ncbi:MAG: hypothetical protein ASARMPRED_001887 [Alectoria sarmentosa]|nr:MAG: hypothetical protein ASARMPRED_001887 [Alectoria sarmentosa]